VVNLSFFDSRKRLCSWKPNDPARCVSRGALRSKLARHRDRGRQLGAWPALLIAAMGEELREDERAIFNQLTGREREPLSVSISLPP
jgi:hypothetical protein